MQLMRPSRTNQERADATRQALLRAARRLFVTHGYAETSTPSIVAAAGITRGALYHHFEDKRALFRAVVDEEARAVVAHIEESSVMAEPLDALLSGADAYLEAMTVAGRTRLLLIDGPAVLGDVAMKEVDDASAALSLHHGLQAAMKKPRGVTFEHLTPLLASAFDRAALQIAAGEDLRSVKAAMRFILERVVGTAPK